MKKALVTIGLFLAAGFAFAQQPEITVFTNERPVGRILATQEEIMAKQYMFPEKIYHSYIDTISKTITVQLRYENDNGNWALRGKIVYYDLTTGRVKWSRNIAYNTSSIKQFDNTIILTVGRRSFRLNNENGENLWRATNDIYFVDPIANIGVGYKRELDVRFGHILEGIDLKTGKRIWQKDLNRVFGWNSMFPVNDSEWLIAASGLHNIDIRNGLGWSYHATTGEIDYSGRVARDALGLFTGYIIHEIGNDLVWDVVSNVYSDNTEIYFASKERIAKINRDNGIVIWQNLFPASLSSKSLLFADDNIMYMVNYGYAYLNNMQISYGTPFIAAYDKENGAQHFFSTINITRNPILDFKIMDDCVLLVFKDRLMRYSLLDGSQILEKIINNEELGELRNLAGIHLYINTDDSYLTNLILSDVSKSFILTNKDKVLIVDEELNIVGSIDTEQMYRANRRIEEYLFVTKDNKTFILNTENKIVAEIDMAIRPTLIGDKLYIVRENSFFEIDVANLIEQLESIQNRSQGVIANF